MLTEDAHTPLIIRLPIHSSAFVIMPGGFGTLDGASEVTTLVQTGKLDRFPVVGMGGSFWPYLSNFARETMLNEGVISPEDLDFIHNVAIPEET